MQIPKGPEEILNTLHAAQYEAWAVGGCVRDSLLGRQPNDWDLCTSALPDQVKEVFRGKLRQKDTGIAHGTVTLLAKDGPVEVTTFRSDGAYTDHRRPDAVQFGVSLAEDLARRDFTVNAMALSTNGEIRDLYHGKEDLEAGIIRCVGEAKERFSEDALRILRALRFASQLDFEIEPATFAAARECAPLLKSVAKERVFAELDKLLIGPGAGRILAQSGEILAWVIPEIGPAVGFDLKSPKHNRDLWRHTADAVGESEPQSEVRWALLLHDLAKPDCFKVDDKGIGHAPGHGSEGSLWAVRILQELRAPNRLIGPVRTLVRLHDNPVLPRVLSVRRWLASLGQNQLEQLILVKRADLAAHAPDPVVLERRRQLEQFVQLMQQVLIQNPALTLDAMAVNGRDLQQAGICVPGPATGKLLRRLLSKLVDGEVPNQKEALLELARILAQEKQ